MVQLSFSGRQAEPMHVYIYVDPAVTLRAYTASTSLRARAHKDGYEHHPLKPYGQPPLPRDSPSSKSTSDAGLKKKKASGGPDGAARRWTGRCGGGGAAVDGAGRGAARKMSRAAGGAGPGADQQRLEAEVPGRTCS